MDGRGSSAATRTDGRMIEAPTRPGTADRTASAQRGLITYLVVVMVLSAVLEGVMIASRLDVLVIVLMWIPGLTAIGVRLVRHEGFGDVSFRFGGRRTWWAILAAILLPVVVGLVAYGLAWTLGLATFAPPEDAPGGSAVGRFGMLFLVNAAAQWIPGAVLAAGEEIGWRGYMLPRMIQARIPHAVLLSGIIWGLWHTPLILSGMYAAGPNRLLSVMVFMVSVVSFGCLIAQARLASGSIWPAIVAHASWNAIIQSVFDRATSGAWALIWTGESGILVAAVLALLAVLSSRAHWPIMLAPPGTGGRP